MEVPGIQNPDQLTKVQALEKFTRQQILQLKFSSHDLFRPGKTIREWAEQTVPSQLRDYIRSPEVTELIKSKNLVLRAHLIIIVGSRHIWLWDMDKDGKLAVEPDLVGVERPWNY